MRNPRAACPIEETSSAALSIEMSEADAPVVVSLEAKADQTPSTVLEGMFELKRQLLGFMCKTRRLVLDSNGYLRRFRGDGFRELRKSFEVTSSTVVVSEPGHDNTWFTVTFHAPNYTLSARAASCGERDRWVEALTEAIRKKTAAERRVDRKELALHRVRHSCWLAVDGAVYDLSKFLGRHPGGADLLMQQAGRDASDAFHSAGARPSCFPKRLCVSFFYRPSSGRPQQRRYCRSSQRRFCGENWSPRCLRRFRISRSIARHFNLASHGCNHATRHG